jgi:hypothetical protein
VLALFAKAGAQSELEKRAAHYKEEAIQALTRSTISLKTKKLLEDFARALIPDFITESR